MVGQCVHRQGSNRCRTLVVFARLQTANNRPVFYVVKAIFANVQYGIHMGKQIHADRLKMKAALQTFGAQPDDVLLHLYAYPQVVRERAEFLRAQELSVFSQSADAFSARGQSAIYNALPDSAFVAQITPLEPFTSAQAGSQVTIRVKAKNISDVTWPALGGFDGKDQINLSYHWLREDGGVLVIEERRASLPRDLKPMAEAVLSLPVAIPGEPGNYLLELDMVQEGVAWFKDKGNSTTYIRIQVK